MSAMANVISIHYLPSSDGGRTGNAKLLYAEGDTDSSTLAPSETVATWLARRRVKASERRSSCVMRTSCDYCGRRKRKCDGDGTRLCSLCKKKGLTCIYSKKLPNRPHHSSAERDRGDVRMLPEAKSVKRCRLSASPATGLVGMAENALLSAFFECMGFVPITRQSNVREAMVRIMTARFATPTSAFAPISETGPGTGGIIRNDLQSDPSLCSFWFAVAMGGLLQGQPKEAVGEYMFRAKAIVDACSKVPTPDLARAWLQMAMMSAFSGDLDGFSANVERAHSVLHDLRIRGSWDKIQPDLLDLEKHTGFMRLLIGKFNSQELHSFVRHDPGPIPQVGSVVTLEEMARFCMHAFRRHGRALFADALANLNKESAMGDGKLLWDEDIERQLDPRLEQHADLLPNAAVTAEPLGGETMEQILQELSPIYERLENVAERPSIRSGIGSLAINMPLCAIRIARQDLNGAVDTASRGIEVLLSYPGLIRFEGGMHVCHLLLTVLSTLECAELFEKLRVGYNEHRSHGPAIPPMQAWGGVGAYCNSLFCLTKERIFREQLRRVIKPELRDNEEASTTGTPIPSEEIDAGARQPPMAGESNWCGLEQMMLDNSTMISDNLGFDSIFELESTGVGIEKKHTFDAFPLGPSSDDPNKAARLTVPMGDLDNAFDQVGQDALRPEDWEVAIDALLEDVTTELALA